MGTSFYHSSPPFSYPSSNRQSHIDSRNLNGAHVDWGGQYFTQQYPWWLAQAQGEAREVAYCGPHCPGSTRGTQADFDEIRKSAFESPEGPRPFWSGGGLRAHLGDPQVPRPRSASPIVVKYGFCHVIIRCDLLYFNRMRLMAKLLLRLGQAAARLVQN